MSGGKLTRVGNECSLAGKKSIGSKPEDDNEKGEGGPVADATTMKKQCKKKNSKAGKAKK